MTVQSPILDGSQRARMAGYTDLLALVERLHRLILDVIKDEFERLGVQEINPVQALLLFNVGEAEVTAGELTFRGLGNRSCTAAASLRIGHSRNLSGLIWQTKLPWLKAMIGKAFISMTSLLWRTIA